MSERPERQTRFRGEGRPKRRLSPSPPPAKPATPKSAGQKVTQPQAKATTTKTRKSTGSTATQEPAHETKRSHAKESRNAVTAETQSATPAPPPAYQTNLQSGNLELVLQQSRQKWLVDGLFEKYWTKYSRKNKEEGSVGKESMTKLSGECTMVIEPHSFKITLFSVRHASNAQTQSPTASHASHTFNSPAAHTPTPLAQAPSRPHPPTQPPAMSPNPPRPAPSAPAPPTPSPAVPTAALTPPAPSPAPATLAAETSEPERLTIEPNQAALAVHPSAQGTEPINIKQEEPPPPPPPPPPAAAPNRSQGTGNTDPVIQLLAARAATDHELKALMKIVAQGNANVEQLASFQRHIDELNEYIQAAKNKPGQVKAEPSSSIQPSGYTQPRAPELQPAPTPRPTPLALHLSQAPRYGVDLQSYYQSPVSFAKPKPAATPKSILSAVVFEFAEANGIRYLLPRNCILEYLRGSMEVQMSFLIVRKGNPALGDNYDEEKQYYVPVNVKLVADSPRLLDMLPKVVAPAEEAQRYMEDVMEKSERAEDIYVGSQLPLRKERHTNGHVPDAAAAEEQELSFEAPNSLIPL